MTQQAIRPFASLTSALRGEVGDYLAKASPMNQVPCVCVAVEGGIQDDTTAAFQQGALNIGAAFENDVVILDDGIAEEHLVLSLTASPIGTVGTVKALVPGIELNAKPVAAGTVSRSARLPFNIRLSPDVCVSITGPTVKKQPGNASRTVNRAIGVILLCLLVLFAVDALDGRNFVLQAVGAAPEPVRAEKRSVSETELRARIAQAGLAPRLTVETTSEDRLSVTGTLDEVEMRKWREIAMWYDVETHLEPLALNIKSVSRDMVLPPISMVRLGDDPEVILASGDTVSVGREFDNGWTLVEITQSGLTLMKEDVSHSFKFSGIQK